MKYCVSSTPLPLHLMSWIAPIFYIFTFLF
jgi:hypothetical protein